MEAVLPAECERARALASQAVDCEVSELERRRLKAHLAACPSCEAFLITLRDVTHELRAAPLPKPSRPLLPKIGRRPPLYVAAIAVAVAALGGSTMGELSSAPAPLRAHAAKAAAALPGARLLVRKPL